VLTDGGSEFRGEFDRVCDELNVRHTRTKPRHAWGRTGLSNAYRERSSTNTGGSPSGAGTSASDSSSRHRSTGSFVSTTSSVHTKGIERKGASPQRSSGVRSVTRSVRRCEVSTPFRYWTS
jgi:hypothetical protein